ncbi:putative lactase-phlorizin hydrolase-like [Apostichopus japonicus]|uniref:beta-glucosidase n=1 Tax=Stichopus japonicus TaxID=307972 RepID=A0A2G8K1T3_STIJA|nr:putative lactase-phlorizin hydrolase-like [Apostichopus japonicus]
MVTAFLPALLSMLLHMSVAQDPYFVYPEVFNDTERDAFYYGTFPEDFQWSTATSSYQIEGAWDADGKGVNIWDTFSHETGNIVNDDNGDVACDSYNKYETDVSLISNMGVKYYRFSLSWSRLLPNGTIDNPSEAGLQYYNNLIDALLENGITPQVTLYHWDLPQDIEDMGGFLFDGFPELFNNYSKYCFEQFGDRVQFWITFNEPWVITVLGYGEGRFAPGINGLEDERVYISAHNLLLAHALSYQTYNTSFRGTQEGVIGITLNCDHFEPYDPSNETSVDAADRGFQFMLGWFASPIFKTGDYPEVMREKVDFKSAAVGLNHYYKDRDIISWQDESWPTSGSEWLRPVPWGLRNLLNKIKNEYGDDIPIYITENGISTEDTDNLDDTTRVQYYQSYINEVLKAVRLDNVNVKCYTAWSLMDNFEWASGYSERFGLHYVDFSDPARPRTPKDSATEYARIVADNGFLEPKVSTENPETTPDSADRPASAAIY